MNNYVFTGPRTLTYQQELMVENRIKDMPVPLQATYHIGCADGADAVVRQTFSRRLEDGRCIIYKAEGRLAWELAKRSKRMIDGCANVGNGKLIAFPNKECPDGVKPSKTFKGNGSGTWGTIAYAKYLGMLIEICWLEDGLIEPDWMRTEQLSLL